MSEEIFFNGVDATTGEYLQTPTSDRELEGSIHWNRREYIEERELAWWNDRFKNRGPDRRPAPDVNPADLASSGWGVIFPEGTSREVREALRPLLEHRREQAAYENELYFRELTYEPGESKEAFLRRYGAEPGPAHPDQLPYYLLIVGDPETVPHRFQYLLDLQYAVGRIHFDRVEDYGHYARSVVDAESGRSHVRPEMTFFAVRREDDRAMWHTATRLVDPLLRGLAEQRPEWKIRLTERADKAMLRNLLGAGETPALLFTSAHGLAFPNGDPLQASDQGALLCEEWRGRGHPPEREHYFAADDVDDDARLHGLIAFCFGCYSAGTPHKDHYLPTAKEMMRNLGHVWRTLAPHPFLAPLAQRLLAHPNGGALAVLGHVDRAWTRSFGGGRAGRGYLHIEALFKQLLDGYPVGAAMDWVHERFAELSTQLTDVLDERREPLTPGETEPGRGTLARLWRANNDARNFVVLGDPAVRLAAGPWPAIGEEPSPARAEVRRRFGRSNLEDVLERLHARRPVHPGLSPAQAVRAVRDRKEG